MDINEMIAANKGLVYSLLRKFYLINDPEAESIAYWSLYKAINTFTEDRGCQLSTYAHCCIYNALGDYVRKLHRKRQLEVVSYNAVAYTDGDTEFTHESLIADNNSVEEDILHKEMIHETRSAITYVLEHMTNKTYKVIVEAWLSSELSMQTKDLAKLAGVSQSYASQALSVFKERVRRRMEDYYK